MPVTVTDTAAREIDSIIRQQDLDAEKICLRVGVKGGGCSGFSYLLDLTEVAKDSDEEWSYDYALKDGEVEQNVSIRVICDPKSYLYLNGTSIDFKDELMGRGFVFNNPNATSSCGCGSSFSA
ncbi:MAG: iron-sulfur cluster assembly accessory protein [Planctomycetota bacterium]|nr:iron-sulfur cluster assembly accessory protein [Planctomycetota bacterium]